MKHRQPRRADWRKKPAKCKIAGRGFIFELHASPYPVKQLPFLKILAELGFQFSMETMANGDGTYTHTFTAPTGET